MSKGYRIYRIILVTLLAATLGLYVAQTFGSRSKSWDQLDLLVDVRHELVNEYVEEVDQQRLAEHAVRAMVASLNDPYTVYLSPEELEPFDKRIRGTFSGIGAEVDIEENENRLRIVSPLEDSPAWEAGVMAGDIVLEINGEDTAGLSINECVERLTGEEGTDVTIKVRHPDSKIETITITRARINVRTVRGFHRNADHHWQYMIDPEQKIGYIRVTQFTETTTPNLKEAIESLKDKHMRGLILDVRFNPGGLLSEAVSVCDMFLDSGKRIVSVKGRNVAERVTNSTGGSTLTNVPIIVLANEYSASASEIVTGALKDNDRALFIGTRTFGKGSVQAVKQLPSNEGALKITHAYYYLPSGRNIHKKPDAEVWGVDPDDGFYVPMTPEQIRAMNDIRRKRDVLDDKDGKEAETVTPAVAREKLKDLQLAAALEGMAGKLADDAWPKVGESGAEQLVKKQRIETLRRQRDILNERLDEIAVELKDLTSDEPSTDGDAAEDATGDTDEDAGP